MIGFQLAQLTSIQMGIDFDTNAVRFVAFRDPLPALNVFSSSVLGNQARFLFNDVSGVGLDLTACDTLFMACFRVVGAGGTTTPVTINNGFTEFSDLNGPFTTTNLNGSIIIRPGMTCPSIAINATVVNPRCNGDANGSITLAVTAATAPTPTRGATAPSPLEIAQGLLRALTKLPLAVVVETPPQCAPLR